MRLLLTRRAKTIFLTALVVLLTLMATEMYSFVRFTTQNPAGTGTAEEGTTEEILLDECNIPKFDIMDESIRQYIYEMKPLVCPNNQPRLTYMSYEGVLHVNQTAMQEEGFTAEKLYECYWQEVILVKYKELFYKEKRELRKSQHVSTETVLVRCQNQKNKTWYENVHLVLSETKHKKIAFNGLKDDRISIFVLVMDSMSRANFIRQMPKSYNYLQYEAGALFMKGHTKVGECTFANMGSLLTGLRMAQNDRDNETPIKAGDLGSSYIDSLPFLWYRYRDKGYLTMFLQEDDRQYGTFQYITKGFYRQPTHFNREEFQLTLEETEFYKTRKHHCVIGQPSHNFTLNYGRQFLHKFHDSLYFSIMLSSEISHDEINAGQLLDDDVYTFLREMKPLLENSILVVMGDHGMRFGDFRKETLIGRWEDSLPLFSIVIPDILHKKHPHLKYYLKANENALTSWFDFHEMLVDIQRADFTLPITQKRSSRHGLSIWRQLVPRNRTCDDAGIRDYYCICNMESPVESNLLHHLKKHGLAVIEEINNMLKPVKEFCRPLSLKKLVKASVLPQHSPTSNVSTIRLVIEASPCGGVFETLVVGNEVEYRVNGDIVRVNMFGDQANCIPARSLRPYCCC